MIMEHRAVLLANNLSCITIYGSYSQIMELVLPLGGDIAKVGFKNTPLVLIWMMRRTIKEHSNEFVLHTRPEACRIAFNQSVDYFHFICLQFSSQNNDKKYHTFVFTLGLYQCIYIVSFNYEHDL